MLKGRIFNSSGLKRCLTDFKKFCLLRHKACFSSLTSSRSLTTLNSNSVSFGKKQFTCQTFVSASCKYRKYHCGLPKKFQVGVYGLTCYCGSVRHYCAPCWHRQTNINRQTWRYPVPSITQIIVPPITVMSRSIVTEKTIAAESPVKTVSTTKKRVARKKTHDKEVTQENT